MTLSAKMPAEYPFSPCTFRVEGGHTISYVDQGQGSALVMVHGNPTWSYLYRNMIAGLSDRYRCIAPDHIGCGLSDKPRDYPYRLRNHIDNLEALLDHLSVEKCVLVAHDWGGAIGMGWAGRHPDRVAGLVVMNTAAFRSKRIPLRIAACRLPLIGPLLVRGLNGFAGPAVRMAVTRKMADEVAAGFLYPYDSWAARIGILRFVQDIPLDEGHPSRTELVRVEEGLESLRRKPMLICWGGRDFCFNDHFYHEWQRRFPDADAHYFPEAGHYVLEDEFAAIYPLIVDFAGGCHG